ncbi:MAG: nucleotidyltransferase family protein [Chloroflexi bacterium]|nr:nucleotidyltransferase family protein [Chloroflexota bacterium]
MVAIVILAAGKSNRMGEAKLKLPLGGRSLLRLAAETALASTASEVVVVLGGWADELEPELAGLAVRVAYNPRFTEGQSTSLVAGIGALGPNADAAIVMLADQPLGGADILDGLIAEWQARRPPIVAPEYDGQRGNPVLFDRSLFPELLEITGDVGAREVIRRHARDVAVVLFPGRPLPLDVDDRSSYELVRRAHGG